MALPAPVHVVPFLPAVTNSCSLQIVELLDVSMHFFASAWVPAHFVQWALMTSIAA